MTPPVRIAQLSCGPEYSGIQHEIDTAAQEVGGEIFYTDVALKDIRRDFDLFGLEVRSPDLKLAIARAMALVEGRVEADAVFIATCFRCAENQKKPKRSLRMRSIKRNVKHFVPSVVSRTDLSADLYFRCT